MKIRAQKRYVVTMANVLTTLIHTAADVNQISLERTVSQRLITVMGSYVRIMELVRMVSTGTLVLVSQVSLETSVKRK